MNIDIEVTVTDHMRSFSDRVVRRLGRAVQKATVRVATEAKANIESGSKSGRTYTRRGRTHQASAPGEAPATEFGQLVNSIQHTMEDELEGLVTVDAEYAAALEFGTRTAEARPFLAPALEKVRPGFIAECQRVMTEEA